MHSVQLTQHSEQVVDFFVFSKINDVYIIRLTYICYSSAD